MKPTFRLAALLGSAVWLLLGVQAHAAPATITYTHEHHIFSVSVARHPEWRGTKRVWFYNGIPATPPARLLSCGKGDPLEPGWSFQETAAWDEESIARTLISDVSIKFDREPGSVTISKTSSGTITFEGNGLTGRKFNVKEAASLTREALEKNIANIVMPVTVTQPQITVKDAELMEMGIQEVVAIGESVFAGSPVNRRHNIKVGVDTFNGHLIPKDGIFSFVETLGPVDASTGYRRELVIQGEQTIPDYGGGLCQVSSTAYRGPWEYGLPIVQRKNHSYAVSYYSPQGTDATIYPPNIDMKFKNDTPGALLIQSFVTKDDHAYFIYYGTKDARTSEVFGPYVSNRRSAPKEEKVILTDDIPPGEKRKAGERHDGMNVLWYRTVKTASGEAATERIFSAYEARPLTWQLGATAEEIDAAKAGAESESPSWLPSNE